MAGGALRWIAADAHAKRAPLSSQAALAEAIAAEWREQGETINPAAMPMTGLANAAIDLAAPDPAAFAEPVAAYAATDLFCYRADRDAVLPAEQVAAWNPMLAWAEERFAIEFAITQGILPIDQPPATVAALRAATFAVDPCRMAIDKMVTIAVRWCRVARSKERLTPRMWEAGSFAEYSRTPLGTEAKRKRPADTSRLGQFGGFCNCSD